MTKNERSFGGKFADEVFGGTPHNIFTSDKGVELKHLSDISKSLDKHQEIAERALHASSKGVAVQSQQVPQYLPPPEVVIDTSALAHAQRDVANQLEGVIDAQQSLAKIAGAHTPLLKQGNILAFQGNQLQGQGNQIAAQSAMAAFDQRNEQIDLLTGIAINSGEIIRQVEGVGMTIAHESHETRVLMQSLLTDIGSKITEMTNEQIITRMALTQGLYRIRSTFLKTHAEVMLAHQQEQGLLQQILEAQRMTENQKESGYQWKRAEIARTRATTVKDLQAVLPMLEKSNSLDDINPLVYISTGTIQSSLGSDELAALSFSEADLLLEQDPGLSIYTLMNLAESLQKIGRHEHAERIMRRATKLAPQDSEVWFHYAKAAYGARKENEAVACLKALIHKNPALYRARIAVDNQLSPLLPFLS
jgi:tetratricopeptide (TPR) repeat protein